MDKKGFSVRQSAPVTVPGYHGLEILDQLRTEYESLSQEALTYKNQKDDFERKLQAQLNELGTIQQTLVEMERNHLRMKQQYEEELVRFRRGPEKLDAGRDIPSFMDKAMPFANTLARPPNAPLPTNIMSSAPPFNAALPQGNPAAHDKRHLLPVPIPNAAQSQIQAAMPVQNPMQAQSQSQGIFSSQSSINPSSGKRPRPEENMYSMGTVPNLGNRIGQIPEHRDAKSPDVHNQMASRSNRNPHLVNLGDNTPKDFRSRTPVEESDSKVDTNRYPHMRDETKAYGERKNKDSNDWQVLKNSAIPNNNVSVELAYTLDHSSVVCCVKFSCDGRYLATGCNKSAQIYDVETGEKTSLFSDELLEVDGTRKEGDLYIRSVCFSPDGKYLAAGAEDRTVKVWDILHRRTRQVFGGHELDIYSLDFSQDGRIIVSGSGDRKTKVWNLEKGELVHTLHNEEVGPKDGVTSVAISPDGRYVACGSLDRIVRIWDIQTGACKERFEGHDDSVYSVSFSPDGTKLASGSLDTTVKIWDLTNSRSQRNRPPLTLGTSTFDNAGRTSNGHKDFVLSVSFSPDGNWLVSGSKDRTVRFWDLRSANWMAQLQGHKNSVISVAVNPTRGLLSTGSGDFRARLWRYSIA